MISFISNMNHRVKKLDYKKGQRYMYGNFANFLNYFGAILINQNSNNVNFINTFV